MALAALLAANAAAEEPPSEQQLGEPAKGTFLDAGGTVRDFAEEYGRHRSDARYEPHYARAALEVGALIAIGTAQYWIAWESNSKDWEFPSLKDRLLFRSMRFDNNTFTTNQLLHPMAGLGYHSFSRASGLGLPAAIFYTGAASLFWEYVLEWRERVSFNDMVFTPVAGTAMGEFVFHLGDYVNSRPKRGAGGVLQSVFGLPVAINSWLDSPPSSDDLPEDNLGLSTAYWHRFEVSSGLVVNRSETQVNDLLGLAGSAELVSMPGFLRPGRFSTLFADGNFTEARVRVLLGDPGLAEFETFASACFAGYYSQAFSASPSGPQGAGAMIGIGTAVSYLDRMIVDDLDQVARAHFAGPHFGFWFGGLGINGRITGDLHADFGAIRSLALPELVADHPDETLRSVFDNGYQYSLGFSGRLRAELGVGPITLEARGDYGAYRSVDGYDRLEEEVTLDTEGSDKVGTYTVGVAINPPGTPLEFSVASEHYWHKSELNEYSKTLSHRRTYTSLGVVF